MKAVTQNLDGSLQFEVKPYSTLMLLDILEHLKDPEGFLDQLRSRFDHTPRTVIITTPNVAFGVQRLMLLLGQFNYGKAGILDRTHTRLFTFRSLRRLLRDAGFKIVEVRGIPAPFPKVLGQGALSRAALAANLLLIRVNRTLFSYQIFVRAETTPDVQFLLRNATEHTAAYAQRLPAAVKKT
jgi:2-polyprenyl-3-methyl-5-hydroxy-6-metoxy-1,4-benzoquinol methylase